MDVWLIVALTVPWLVGTVWLAGLFLWAIIDPQGGDFGPGRGLALITLAFVAPAGLGGAARSADLGGWWLYLTPYAIGLLIIAYLVFVVIINRWSKR